MSEKRGSLHRGVGRRIRSHWSPRKGLLAALLASLTAVCAVAGVAPVAAFAHHGGGTLTDQDLRALIGGTTLPEEIGMVHGTGDPPADPAAAASCAASPVGCVGEAGWIPGVARLGIPPLRFTDGPAGIRLRHVETAMPAPVGLSATFDPGAANLYGSTVGKAGRATNQDVWLAPMINQVNFPTGGRNFETLGEDPYLASQLVAEEVTGVQDEGMISEIKHFAENDFENGRRSTSVSIGDQALHQTELQAFEAGVDAGAGAVMCAYNRVNDVYACSNDQLLGEILRETFNFAGFVTSDWGAVHRISDLVQGTDIEQPGNPTGTSMYGTAALTDAVTNGTAAVPLTNDFPAVPAYTGPQWKAALDTAVFRILWVMNRAGLLEGTQFGTHFTGGSPYVPPRPVLESLKQSSSAAAQSIAEESATLLKNDTGGLPLSRRDLRGPGLLVMGPTAIAPYIDGGGSSHVTPYDPAQGPFDALVAAAGAGAHVRYVPGYDLDGALVPAAALTAPDPANPDPDWTLTPADSAFAGQHGLLRQQITTAPVASGSQPVLQPGGAPDQLDATIDDTATKTLPAGTGWRWTGTLTAPSAGAWQLKVFVAGQASAQLFVDGLTTVAGGPLKVNIGSYPAAPATSYAGLGETSRSHDPANESLQQSTFSVTYAAGEQHHLDLRLVTGATTPAQLQFRWIAPDGQAQSISSAVAAARSAGKVVIFAYDEGTEGSDRGGSNQAAGLSLPGYQDALISAVAAVNPDTVVVLNTGDPVLMPWAGAVRSILEMWYPGQMGGPATADVLLGEADPGGKLPVTFPADAAQLPTSDPGCTDTSLTGNCPLYPGTAQPGFLSGLHGYATVTNLATNGIFQGYRWYDEHDVQPLFPFGFGLSYTSFDYSGLRIEQTRDGGLDVAFRVRNVGDRWGADVPQVYIGPGGDVPAGVQQAVRSLVQFTRIELAPGQVQEVTLHVAPRQLAYWSTARQGWVVATGLRQVFVGASSRDIRLSGSAEVRWSQA